MAWASGRPRRARQGASRPKTSKVAWRTLTNLKTLTASAWHSAGSCMRGVLRGTVSIPKAGSCGHRAGAWGQSRGSWAHLDPLLCARKGQSQRGKGSSPQWLDGDTEA